MVKDGFNIFTGGPVILYISKPVFVVEEYSKPTCGIKIRIEIQQSVLVVFRLVFSF